MKTISKKFVKVLMYVFGYLNIVAAVVGCGYVLLKSEDKGCKTAARNSLILSVIFAALSALYSFISYFFGTLLELDVYRALNIINAIVGILKIAAYVTMIVFALLSKDLAIPQPKDKEKSSETEDEQNKAE